MDAGYLVMRARAQQTLIDFLFTELKLGTTLAESAALAKEAGHMAHYASAIASAEKAADSVRRFVDRVSSLEIRAQISDELASLDRRVASVRRQKRATR